MADFDGDGEDFESWAWAHGSVQPAPATEPDVDALDRVYELPARPRRCLALRDEWRCRAFSEWARFDAGCSRLEALPGWRWAARTVARFRLGRCIARAEAAERQSAWWYDMAVWLAGASRPVHRS